VIRAPSPAACLFPYCCFLCNHHISTAVVIDIISTAVATIILTFIIVVILYHICIACTVQVCMG
jgi:hypothetical protein